MQAAAPPASSPPLLLLLLPNVAITPPGTFVICWTPGLLTLLLDGLLGANSHAYKYEKFCLVIAECNSLVNPVIYSLRDQEMRATFKSILCCLCRRGVGQQGAPLGGQVVLSQPEGESTKVGHAQNYR